MEATANALGNLPVSHQEQLLFTVARRSAPPDSGSNASRRLQQPADCRLCHTETPTFVFPVHFDLKKPLPATVPAV